MLQNIFGSNATYKDWITLADEDLAALDILAPVKEAPQAVVCFHAQQAVEKLLKAFLVFHRQAPTEAHNVAALIAEAGRIDPALRLLARECEPLSNYFAMYRSPDGSARPDCGEAREAVAAAHKMKAEISSRLET